MSYRLITKAFALSLNGVVRQADIRAYAAPKTPATLTATIGGSEAPIKLTGGIGRGSVVRSYMYFMFNEESAYIEITGAEYAAIKAGAKAEIIENMPALPPETILERAEIAQAAAEVEAPKAARRAKTK